MKKLGQKGGAISRYIITKNATCDEKKLPMLGDRMKKKYETPKLIKHGSIEELTQIGQQGTLDNDGLASRPE